MDKTKKAALLDRAVASWRAADRPTERLSDSARRRILQVVEAPDGEPARRERPLAPLFVPWGRTALAAAIPAVLLTAVLGLALMPRRGSVPLPLGTTPSLQVSKENGEVVFLIANGDRDHRVYKSVRPDGADPDQLFTTTRDSFRDRLDSGPELVFYRID